MTKWRIRHEITRSFMSTKRHRFVCRYLVTSCKIIYTHFLRCNSCTDIYSDEWKIISTRMPSHNVLRSFICRYASIKVTNTSFIRWLNKEKIAHPYNRIMCSKKKNEVSIHENTWRKSKWILHSKTNPCNKAIHCIFTNSSYSRTCKLGRQYYKKEFRKWREE